MDTLRVKLTFPGWPIERQTPNHLGRWGNCQFYCNTEVDSCDFWVVCEGLSERRERTICPPDHLILVTCEPPAIKTYKKEFLDQFAAVITCHKNIAHRNPIFSHPALPWHVGRRQRNHVNIEFSKDYDQLIAITSIRKEKLISVISSAKSDTEGHRQRLQFVDLLREKFGSKIDVFGRGIQEVEDKWEALAPYKYHVALENSAVEHYWTEKLSDPLLAGCHPIYYGCPNIDNYFDARAITKIDITKPSEAVGAIQECLANDTFRQTASIIWQERQKILNHYNLFAMLAQYLNNLHRTSSKKSPARAITLLKEPSDSNVLYQIRQKFTRLGKLFG